MFVRNTKPRIIGLNTEAVRLLLKPGVNQVLEADFAQLKDHKITRILLADGTLEVLDAPREAGEPGSAARLREMSASAAAKLVGQTFDEQLLGAWLDEEERETVIKAIEKQLEKLNKA